LRNGDWRPVNGTEATLPFRPRRAAASRPKSVRGSALPDSRRTLGSGRGGVALGRCLRCGLDGPWHPSDLRRPLAPPIDLGGPMCPIDPGAALQTFRAQADCDSRGPGPGPAQTAQGPLGDSPARRVGSWLAADVLARINDHAIHRLSQLFAMELGERVGAS
jgi:hypothetical protein